MKKYSLLLFGLLVLCFSACKKDKTEPFDAAAQAAADENKIQAYIKANNIDATRDNSGIYYQVITAGTGNYPSSTSTVTVNYNGKLLNGTTFGSGTLSNYALSDLIKGWQFGIPKINTGGRILLLIPSGLGYGNQVNGSIPANSVLVFTVDLLSFK